MSNVVQLWNPRGHRNLRRHWVSFAERIVISGEHVDQSAVLSVLPTGCDELRVTLRCIGGEFEERITPGHDITVRLHGVELVIGVKAVDEDRMLVEFGVPFGRKVRISLDCGEAVEPQIA